MWSLIHIDQEEKENVICVYPRGSVIDNKPMNASRMEIKFGTADGRRFTPMNKRKKNALCLSAWTVVDKIRGDMTEGTRPIITHRPVSEIH